MNNIEEIQQEVKDKFGVEISEDEIESIITNQSRCVKLGMENEQDIRLIYFGIFKIKPGRKGALNRNNNVRKNLLIPRIASSQLSNKEIKVVGIGIRKEEVNNIIGEGEQLIKLD